MGRVNAPQGNKSMTNQSYPEPTVGALIFNPEGQILLVRSHKWRNQYVIPGGHIELGETIIAALKRETKEETDLDIYDIEFIGFQEFIFDDVFWKKRHFIFFDYACKTESTQVKLNSESEEHLWVAIEDIVNLPVEPYTRRAIHEYLKKHSV
jgi:nucleoside triphosphatase